MPGATSTSAFGINDSGEIAGFFSDSTGQSHGFILSSGLFHVVDVAGAKGTLVTRLKNDGAIAGVYGDALDEQHGMVGR